MSNRAVFFIFNNTWSETARGSGIWKKEKEAGSERGVMRATFNALVSETTRNLQFENPPRGPQGHHTSNLKWNISVVGF